MKRRKSEVTQKKKKEESKSKHWMNGVKANCRFFLESTSIRGCSRIVNSENQIIRYMWAAYLCFTTLFLHISIMKLVYEYMEYAVNIQTYIDMDAPMDFPTVTFCNHQPFSSHAYQLWRNGSIVSPTRFSQLLRGRAAELLVQSVEIPPNGNETIRLLDQKLLLESIRQGIVYDTLTLYYQSIEWPQHLELGHRPKELIALCLFRYGNLVAVTGPGCEDDALRVRRQSDPKFFNCFSVEIVKEFSQHIKELGLVLWLGPDDAHGKADRQAFLFDLFEQAYGLRVAVHEPGQMANLDRQSFQVAPGRMNELTFQTVKTIHYDRPPKPCAHNPKRKYADLDERYDYEFEVCLNSHLQERIIEECECLYAYYPRVHQPNRTLPYCGKLIDDNEKLIAKSVVDRREHCAENIVKYAAVFRKVIEDTGTCKRRCESTEYESQVSVTKWRPTGWQLYWSQKMSSLYDAALNGSLNTAEVKTIEHFLKTSNLAEVDNSTSPLIFDERYTYLVVRRKSNDTVIKEENLVLTVNALFSRIGGLCSLYIGLTLAVFMEFVEFIYLAWIRRKKVKRSLEEPAVENDDNLLHNSSQKDLTEDALSEKNITQQPIKEIDSSVVV
ncbi:hypothetical protein Aperf_G00000120198 [Anoplocephala perfoliata]